MSLYKTWIQTGKHIINEAFSSASLEKAVSLIVKMLERNLGEKLYQEYGVNQFQNKWGKGFGLRYFIGNTDGAFRLNFGQRNEIVSVDVWEKGSNDKNPSIHIDTAGLSVVKILPQLVDLINNPKPKTIEVDLNEAVDEETEVEPLLNEEIVVDGETYKNASAAIKSLLGAGMTRDAVMQKVETSPQNVYRIAKQMGLIGQVKAVKGSTEKNIDPEVKKAEKMMPEFADPETVFEDLEDLLGMVITGLQSSLLITGGAGLGKTYTVTQQIKQAGLKKDEDWFHVKGKASPMALYRELFAARDGKLIVFDDCDSVLVDPNAVNILKAALDSYDVREISWKSPATFDVRRFPVGSDEYNAKIEDGKYPNVFEFTGRVIFISNLHANKIDAAVKSRSFTIDLTLRAKDVLVRIRSIIPHVMPGAGQEVKEDAFNYLKEAVEEKGKTTGINIRTFLNACKMRMSGSPNWKRLCEKYA